MHENGERSTYWSRHWSRRKLLGASAGMAAAAVVGCGGDDDSNGGGDGSTATQPAGSGSTATPRKGGVLHMLSSDNPATFDLHQNISVVTTAPMAPIFNKLVRMNPAKDNEIVPDLATTLPEQPDASTYVFRLPPNVLFSDGTQLTAEDVKANYEWMISPPKGKVSTRQSILAPVVDRIEVVDTTTVKFVLKQPSASFMINQVPEFLAIGPKAVLVADGDLSKNPIGSGPFLKKAYQPGVSFELERNPKYFKAGFPYLDGIFIHIINDRRTVLEQFFEGAIHMISASVTEKTEIQQRAKDAVLTDAPSNARDVLFMLCNAGPFKDIRARQALSLAFDRDDHLQLVYQGRGAAIGGYMAPPPAGAWALPESEIKAISGYGKADLAQAKQLLSAAGVPEGSEIKVVSRSISPDLATYTLESLRKLGLKASSQVLDSAAAYAAGDKGTFELLPWATVPALDDPDAVFGDYGGQSGAVRNWGRFSDSGIDDLYKRQTASMDVNERKKLVNELDKKHLTSFVTITLGYSGATWVHNKKVKGKAYQMNENYTNRQMDTVWLDA